MDLVKELAKLPGFVEYQGCVFILCTGRDYKKGSELADGISLWYRLDSVDKQSEHFDTYQRSGSWEKPDYGLCNFLVLYEYIDNTEELIDTINKIERYLISLGIEL